MAYRNTIIELDSENYKIAPMIKETLTGIIAGSKDDKNGWVVPVKSSVLA